MGTDSKQTFGAVVVAPLAAGLGGVLGTAVDVVVLAALVERGAAIAPSAFAGSVAGAGVSFVISKYVAFGDRSPVRLRQVAAFGLVGATTALLTAIAMQLAAVVMGVPYLLAKALCAAGLFVLWSYPAQRRLVFRASPRSRVPAASPSLTSSPT